MTFQASKSLGFTFLCLFDVAQSSFDAHSAISNAGERQSGVLQTRLPTAAFCKLRIGTNRFSNLVVNLVVNLAVIY